MFANEGAAHVNRDRLIARSFNPLLAQAGLRRIRFHDLRHTAATLLLAQGVRPKIAQEMLGHANIAVTLDRYSHVSQDMQQDAARLMGEVLSGPRLPA